MTIQSQHTAGIARRRRRHRVRSYNGVADAIGDTERAVQQQQQQQQPLPRRRRRRSTAVVLALAAVAVGCCFCRLPSATASSAAGTETLVGIVGRDFVLLAADSSVSQSIALTASNLDKIAHLVDPFPDHHHQHDGDDDQDRARGKPPLSHRRQQAILAAAAGDAADSDRLLGYLKAIGSLEEYTNDGPFPCDVVHRSLDDEDGDDDGINPDDDIVGATYPHGSGGLDVLSMAHLTRRCIWERLRSQTPYRVCLLVAGMMPNGDANNHDDADEPQEKNAEPVAFLSKGVQKQVRQASGGNRDEDNDSSATTRGKTSSSNPLDADTDDRDGAGPPRRYYTPALYWLDEYGSLRSIDYGAHGHGSNFLLSILDQHYRPDLTRAEALHLIRECFRELRNRYVINSPEAPCIKCVDARGITVLPAEAEAAQQPPP